MHLRSLLNRSTNSLIIFAAAAAGLWLPHITLIGSLTVPIVAFLVYISLRGIEFQEASDVVRPRPIAVGLVVSYVALPAAAYVLAPLLSEPDSQLGLYIVAAVPTTAGSSIVWTKLSEGDVELASVLAVVSIVVAPIATPLVLSFLAGSVISLSPGAVIADLLIIIGGGVALRIVLPTDALTEQQVNNGARASIAVLVYVSISQLDIAELAVDVPTIVAAVVALLMSGFLISLGLYRVSSLTPTARSAVFFSGSLKNLGVGLLVVDILSVPAATIVVVAYYLCQQLAGALAADMLFPHQTISLCKSEDPE